MKRRKWNRKSTKWSAENAETKREARGMSGSGQGWLKEWKGCWNSTGHKTQGAGNRIGSGQVKSKRVGVGHKGPCQLQD